MLLHSHREPPSVETHVATPSILTLSHLPLHLAFSMAPRQPSSLLNFVPSPFSVSTICSSTFLHHGSPPARPCTSNMHHPASSQSPSSNLHQCCTSMHSDLHRSHIMQHHCTSASYSLQPPTLAPLAPCFHLRHQPWYQPRSLLVAP